ncbi:hypothetical protein JOC37_002545 [Desulfohalotomaculum tongense]|uniref:peroxide stress protein YaaA n=1 Tax=Desulforadius tongensis TaxID=1216062 RepID=UPI001956706B|nr:peroxide stress protein YaaA [Desulforadius tongensis]MBM7856115.1 hypothetical protein [Desulforadius tongensis]
MNNILLIFPCCAEKVSGGESWKTEGEVLKNFISQHMQKEVNNARNQLLSSIKKNQRYIQGKYKKNESITFGPDFGNDDIDGKYMPAIKRYCGQLYSPFENFKEEVINCIKDKSCPHLLILSALYGPLHPLDMVQDYNLKMSDPPAYKAWKEHFPSFLKEYVKMNGIKEIKLYFGRSTHYLKVAKQAVIPLLQDGLLSRAANYEVEEGNSYHTPYNHGLLIAKDLQIIQKPNLTRNINEIEL